MSYKAGLDFARSLDQQDALAHFRDRFHIPPDCIYLCGNSLGLQPKSTVAALAQELEDWRNLGVEGHLHARNPWLPYHESITSQIAELTGSRTLEVVAMNGLTVNLHLMMVSFYRPTPERHKILVEANNFPSDRYAVESQIRFHGYDPATSLVFLEPRNGECTLRPADILRYIRREGKSIAMLLIGGVNFYTGQAFDMESIARVAHEQGCVVGFDLAHAIGNIPLRLHEWGPDFACWCTYKYLNAGPGSVAGCFVHERHANEAALPRFHGWWGHQEAKRFKMGPRFQATPGAEGWQLSNPPILSLAAVKASLDIIQEAGMDALRKKSVRLTGYLEYLLTPLRTHGLKILTPHDPTQRGAQISITLEENGHRIFEELMARGIICDWREPDCIRVAPVPLYNTFVEVYGFVDALAKEMGAKR